MDATGPKPDQAPAANPAAAPPTQPQPQAVPADALSRSNEDLGETMVAAGTELDSGGATGLTEDPKQKKVGKVKRFFRRVNVYLLMFILIVIIVGAVSIVSYLNSKKANQEAATASTQLTQEALQDLANSDTTVGDSAQTLTVKGNSIFSGQVLIRSDLNVAGTIQSGGGLQAPSLSISGQTSLGETQISNLQVANNVTAQGNITLKDLNVGGAATFSGPITAAKITVSQLVLSGNAALQVPNHISFPGTAPTRSSIDNAVLGNGGTASINGSDTAGTININTGSNPTAGCFINLKFNQAFTNPPHVTVGPIGSAAGLIQYYIKRTTTEFSLCTNNAAGANQVFAFDYFVTN